MQLLNYYVLAAVFLKSTISYPNLTYDGNSDYSCLPKIAEKYFTEKRINIFLGGRSSEFWQDDIRFFSNWTVEIQNEDVTVATEFDFHVIKSEVMILVLQAEEDNKIVEKLKKFRASPTWSSTSKILIFIKEHNQIRLVLKTLWEIARAVNVVTTADCHIFYTWKPYQKNDCNEVKNISILKFSELFSPNDFSNLNRCKIFVQSSYIPPYVLEWDRNTSQFKNGMEVQIIKNIAEHINFIPAYLPDKRGFHAWLTRHPNGTIAGSLSMLKKYEVDIAFSCIMLNYERFMNADGLVPHTEDEIVWFVPTPRIKPQVATMMRALHKYIWIGIFASIFLSSIFLYFKEKSPSFINLVLKMTASFLNIPVKTKTRLPLFLAYVAALHTVTSYNSWMSVNLMKEMTDKPITSLQEIADKKNLKVYLLPSLANYYNQSDFAAWENILQPGRYVYNELLYDQLEEIANNKTAVLLFPKLPALYYIGNRLLDENGVPRVNYLKPRFLSSKVTFYLAPGHPLTPIFNKKMMQLIESGLPNFWTGCYVNRSVMTRNNCNYQEGNKPLTVKNLSAGFYYYATLNVFSFLIFLCELIRRFVEKRNQKKILIHHMKFFEKDFKYLK